MQQCTSNGRTKHWMYYIMRRKNKQCNRSYSGTLKMKHMKALQHILLICHACHHPACTQTRPYPICTKQPLKGYSLKPLGPLPPSCLLLAAICQKQNDDDKNKVAMCFLACYLFTAKLLRPSTQHSVNSFMYFRSSNYRR
jgi:hypothetical protein